MQSSLLALPWGRGAVWLCLERMFKIRFMIHVSTEWKRKVLHARRQNPNLLFLKYHQLFYISAVLSMIVCFFWHFLFLRSRSPAFLPLLQQQQQKMGSDPPVDGRLVQEQAFLQAQTPLTACFEELRSSQPWAFTQRFHRGNMRLSICFGEIIICDCLYL